MAGLMDIRWQGWIIPDFPQFGHLTVSKTRQSISLMSESDLLRANGIPVTAQRIAVIKAVKRRTHATADEIVEEVKKEIGAISRQAVYNVLSLLSDKGILRRTQPAGSPARYEDRVGDNHHHVVCRVCGHTENVDCAVGYTPCLHAAQDHGYLIDEAEVIYWGYCPRCRKDKEQSS